MKESANAVKTWLSEYGKATFLSIDFQLGLAAGAFVLVGCLLQPGIRDQAVTVLLAEAALGAAFLGVALTALTILVGVLDLSYLRVLVHANGVRQALMPFQTIAFASGLSTVLGLMGAAAVGGASWPLTTGAMTVSTAATVWTITGTVQLVNLVSFHGEQRGELLHGIAEARRIADQARSDRAAS